MLPFLRRLAIACVVVPVVTLVGVYAGDAYGKREFEKSRTVHITDGVLEPLEGGEPANYLLIGSDTRAFVDDPAEAQAFGTDADTGEGRSDVMMVLHVEPDTKRGFLVSFPRDLVVEIPGHGRDLLNTTYVLGGPDLVIETLQTNFEPLRINHYLEVDFEGFRNIVNEIGKIHVWFPTPVHDEFTGLHIEEAGCASLDGDQALAYARSRHYNIPRDVENPAPWQPGGESKQSAGWIEDPRADLDRIPRQQYFLRTVSQAAIDKIGDNPAKIDGLLKAVYKNFAHDQFLKYGELKALARIFKGLNPTKVDMMTLPVEESPSWRGKVVAKYPDAGTVIARLADFPVLEPDIPGPLPAHEVEVRIVNGSGEPGAAAGAAAEFADAGFELAGEPADADRDDYENTQVRYAPGKFFEGFTVGVVLGTKNVVEAASDKDALDAEVLVIVGRDYSRLPHNFAALPEPDSSSPTSRPTSTPTTIGDSSTTTAPVPTTTTTIPTTVDTRFVPVDPKTGGPLVGCPTG